MLEGMLRQAPRLAATLLTGLTLAASVAAPAVPRVQAVPTNLSSDSDRIISYRHQEHLWQTADGALHVLINRGTLTPGPGLALFSSFDGGVNWQLQQAFPETDADSVSDGQLAGNELHFMLETAGGNLVFRRLAWDGVLRGWTLAQEETAWASSQFAAVNASVAVDAQGTLWCAFDARDRATNDVNIRLLVRPAAAAGWQDSGQVFGPTDHRSIERSARPVAVPGGMGLLFTVRETAYWAERTDAMALDAPWPVSTVFVGVPTARLVDPYASHFSVVADDAGFTHLFLVDSYDVLYFKRDPLTRAWAGGARLDDDKKTAYTQGSIVNGKLAAAWSVQRGAGSAVVSADGGASFQPAASLLLPPDAPGVSYGQARVEMPTRATGPLVILQQYSDNGLQRLMVFRIPAP